MNNAVLALAALPVTTLLSAVFGRYALNLLRRLKLGQHIREEGPQSHLSKGGTPTMGGVIFLLPLLLVTLLFSGQILHTGLLILSILLITALGFYDDLQKILLRNNKGITPKQKLAGQMAIGALLGLYLMLGVPGFSPELYLPFSRMTLPLGWLYIPFMVFFFTATTNAVNLTDGLDGLASTVSIIVLAGLCAMLFISGAHQNEYSFPALVLGMSALGGCVGFLWYNSHPAQVFMGDTGSLALGGIFCVIAALGHLELWFALMGLIFVAEALSVMIQVAYFKKTGKRIFRMSPLHHHYELGGWKETQVVSRFGIVSFVLSFSSVLIFYALQGGL